jgi:quinol monooxygenase YgiN
MNDAVAWHVELAVRPAQFDAFRKLTAEMVEFAATETGVLAYERFVSADGGTVHVYERYESSDAAIAHLRISRANSPVRFRR